MKKIASIALGLGMLLGTVSAFAQDSSTDKTTTTKKHKTKKHKKGMETTDQTTTQTKTDNK